MIDLVNDAVVLAVHASSTSACRLPFSLFQIYNHRSHHLRLYLLLAEKCYCAPRHITPTFTPPPPWWPLGPHWKLLTPPFLFLPLRLRHSLIGDSILLFLDRRPISSLSNCLRPPTVLSSRGNLGTEKHQIETVFLVKPCLVQLAVVTIHGSTDKTIVDEDTYKFAKIIAYHKLHIIEGAYHRFKEHRNQS